MIKNDPILSQIRKNQDIIINHYSSARKVFHNILDLIQISGFGNRKPSIYMTSFGRVVVEYEDVEVDILLLLEYINEDGVLTKENWHKMILNNP